MRETRLVALLLIGLVVAAGCGRKQTYYGQGGKVTVDQQGKSVQVQTDQGAATVNLGKKSITEAELGAPVYPGATGELSGSYQAAGGSQQDYTLTTPDSFDRVLAFYKSKLKNADNTLNQSTDKGQYAMFLAKAGDGSDLSLQIMTSKDKKVTRIHVIRTKRGK